MSLKKIFVVIGLITLLTLITLMVNQHIRYSDARFNAVKDYQDAFHGDVFHVLTFVRAANGQDFMAPLIEWVVAAKGTEGQLIYAGQVIHVGIESRQITDTFGDSAQWQAILLQQFDSQEAYETYLERPEIRRAATTHSMRGAIKS